MTKDELMNSIARREKDSWAMAQTFLDNRDAHGIMDMGSKLQALERSRKEVEKL